MNVLLKAKSIRDLSGGERQAVNFILHDPETAAGLGIAELAQKSYTSTGTIMRLCKKLGFDGYAAFRLRLAADLREYNALHASRDPAPSSGSVEDVVRSVTESNLRAVQDVQRFNSSEKLRQVMEKMGAARQIDFYGSGVSNLICQDAMIKAMRIGIPSTAYPYYTELGMLARTCTPDHLAIVLSYTGQTQDTLRAAAELRRRSIPSVSITSHTDNPLLPLCDINLFVDSYESIYRIGGMSSRLSSLHLIDILFSLYINLNYARLRDTIYNTFLPETFHHLGLSLAEE